MNKVMQQQNQNLSKISHTRRLHLARLEQAAAKSELAARLAHHFRNPLTAIQAACRSLREEIRDEDHCERLDLTLLEVRRMLDMVSKMLEGASHEPERARDIDVGALLMEVAALLRHELPERITLRVEAAPALRCRLPPDGLCVAVMDLIHSAEAALQGQDEGEILLECRFDAGRLYLRVADNRHETAATELNISTAMLLNDARYADSLELSVAQRYARQLGGRLRSEDLGPDGAAVILELPCTHD